jgi:hypothetical protein
VAGGESGDGEQACNESGDQFGHFGVPQFDMLGKTSILANQYQ